jgi:hypothetical protein
MNIEDTKKEVLNHVAELNNAYGENVDMEYVSQTLAHGSDEEIIRLEQKFGDRRNELHRKSMGIDEPERSTI